MAANYKRLQFRRGTVTDFAAFNPVLASGEPAIALENGSGLLKIGDGHTAWNSIAGLRTDVDDTIISGIAVFASGNSGGGGGGDVSTSQFQLVSGIAIFASGKALAGGGSGPSTAQHQIVSGIAVYSSGQSLALAASSGALNTSVGALQTATGLLNTASGALNTSVGLLNTSSGVLNTNVGLLQVASGSLNTTAGLNTSNFQTLSGITVVSQSGNFGYNSTASGNISGVLNLVMVDQAAYNSLVKKTNTLYFIPSG